MPRVPVSKIKVGDCVGTPGDARVRTRWVRVSRIDRDDGLITLHSPDGIPPGSRATETIYMARPSESLPVSPAKCKR